MIRFIRITAFRVALDALLKIKRNVYAGVTMEICKAFQNLTIDQIRSNRDMILMDNDSIVIKLRLPDKKQRLSKADGYRLIYMVMKTYPIVVLLHIYPKRGPMQKIDLEENELKELLKAFTAEMKSGEVVLHDINNNLETIVETV